MARKDEFWMWLAWHVPSPLVYWCCIRAGAHATCGQWGKESPTDLLMLNALKRWESKDG